jgi:hypothetical protein
MSLSINLCSDDSSEDSCKDRLNDQFINDSCEEIGLTEDEKFARKLQKEFDAEKRSVEEFECPICIEEKPIDSKFIYQNCDHEQCRECASEFFLRQIELKNKINCVLCQKEVATLDLELVLSTDMVRKHLKTHNLEGGQYDDNNNDGDDENDEEPVDNFNNVANHMPVFVRRPVPKPKAVVAPRIFAHAHPAKKVAKKVIHKVPVRRAIPTPLFEASKPRPASHLDREYFPEKNENERKTQRTPHTRYDRTSSDSDSYDVPKKIRKTASTKKLFDT